MKSRKSKSSQAEIPDKAKGMETKGIPVWAVCFGLALLTFVIFSPVLKFDFLNFDDPVYVTRDPYVPKGLVWENVMRSFTGIHANFWHPLTTLSHMLDCELYGMKPGGHHFTSLLFHVGSVVLLFLFLHRMTGAMGRSAMVAALFAWHPAHVESVAWVAERKDVLSTFFWMLTLFFYVRYAQSRTSGQRRQTSFNYILTLLSFVLGLLAKPMLVTLPFVLLLLDFWPLKRMAEANGTSHLRRSIFQLLREKIPFFILTAIAIVITIKAQKHGGAIMASDQVPVFTRVQNAAISYLAYIGKALWPTNLAVFYPYPQSISGWLAGFCGVALAGVTLIVFRMRRFGFLTTGWFWYVGTLVPVIGLMQVGSHAMADRYTYVPYVGLFMAMVWGAYELALRFSLPSTFVKGLSMAVLILCGLLTAGQVKHWKDSGTLFEHALAVTKRNPVAHVQLAAYAATRGEWDKADLHAQQALAMFPDSRIAHHVMALVCEAKQNWPAAVDHFSRVLAATPDSVEDLFGLANALSHLGQVDAAVEKYFHAIRLRPHDPFPRNNLGNLLLTNGRIDEAIAQYTEALRLKPDYEDARYNLELARQQQGK